MQTVLLHMLDQVPMSGPLCARGLDKMGDSLPLMEAREEHRLGTDLPVRQRIDFVGDM